MSLSYLIEGKYEPTVYMAFCVSNTYDEIIINLRPTKSNPTKHGKGPKKISNGICGNRLHQASSFDHANRYSYISSIFPRAYSHLPDISWNVDICLIPAVICSLRQQPRALPYARQGSCIVATEHAVRAPQLRHIRSHIISSHCIAWVANYRSSISLSE